MMRFGAISIHWFLILEEINVREGHLPQQFLSVMEKLQCVPFWAHVARGFP